MKNKEYPLKFYRNIKVILEGIREIYLENKNLVRLQKDKDKKDEDKTLLHIVDKDPGSDFYFKVILPVKKISEYTGNKYTITDLKPVSDSNTGNGSHYSNRESYLDTDTINAFKSWIELLKEYNEADDTIPKIGF